MRGSSHISGAVLSLVLFLAATLAAQTSGAMLYATGDVTLNGTAVQDASSVFNGDRLVTANSSMVSVNRSGSSVVVNPNSAIQYKKSAIALLDGTAQVSTVNGMSAEVGNVIVAPKDQSAKFDVARINNQVVVTSRQGTVAVNDGSHTIVLQPGDHTTLALGSTAGQGSSQSEDGPFLHKSALVANGPFYSLASPADDLPWCPSVLTCIRPNVSQIRPCKCPPRPH